MKFSSVTEHLISKVTGKALYDYKMISRNDKVLVCVSGRDSLTLLKILRIRQRFVPIKYKLIAAHIDQNAKNAKVIEDYLKKEGIEYYIIKADLNAGKKDIFECPYGRHSNRAFMRKIIKEAQKRCPNIKVNIFRSPSNIRKAYLP